MSSYIYIDGWKTNIRFSSAHIIPEYEKCGRLHGHTYAVYVKVSGKYDKNGIIMDFSALKRILKKITDNLDHKILIPEKNNTVKIQKDSESVKISFHGKEYLFPSGDCVFLPIDSTSAENLSTYILEQFLDQISIAKNIDSIQLGVDEGFGQGARIIKLFKKSR
jgi:6-pyruvoyltetrahydropterin/6-carboxytetrahydropterin synthase